MPVVLGDRIYSVTVAGPLFRVADKAEEHAAALYDAIAAALGPDHLARTLRDMQPLAR